MKEIPAAQRAFYVVIAVAALFVASLGLVTPAKMDRSFTRMFLQAQGVAFALVGLALLIAPSAMVDAWPWPISAGLAQFYGGPFLAYAACSGHYAGKPAWADLAAIAPAMLVFTSGTIIVSLQHSELFSSSDLAAWAWFGGFGAAALALLVMSARALQAGTPAGRSVSTEPA